MLPTVHTPLFLPFSTNKYIQQSHSYVLAWPSLPGYSVDLKTVLVEFIRKNSNSKLEKSTLNPYKIIENTKLEKGTYEVLKR